jgi:hypothetical protein
MTAGSHEPIGFVTKIVTLPHARAAWLGAGLYDIQVRVGAELMLRPELLLFAELVEALPDIIADEVAVAARSRGVDSGEVMLFAGALVGWDEQTKRFAMVTFDGPDFAPQRTEATLIGIPNVPPDYLPAGFVGMTPELRAIAAMRSIRRFTDEHGNDIGLPPIGGEIVLTELLPDRISTRVAARFENYPETCEAIERTRRAIAADPAAYVGVDLAHRFEDRAAAERRVEAIFRAERGVPDAVTRAERRRAERNAKRIARVA